MIPESWSFVQSTLGVIGFLGGERPAPLSDEEVNSIVNQIEEKKGWSRRRSRLSQMKQLK